MISTIEAPINETQDSELLNNPPPPADKDEENATFFEGINISGATVTKNTAHLPEEQLQLLRWLYHYARENNMTWQDITRATKIDKTTLWRIWHDKYRNPTTRERVNPGQVCEKIARFKKLSESRDAVADAGFLETSVWHRINWLCERAFVRQKIGFIFGEARFGKTLCLKEYRRRNNHGQTTYVEMPPSSGVQLMTSKIAKALFVPERKAFNEILDTVLEALDSSKLLIIDEIHRVFTTYQKGSVMRCLDVLRYIHDQTECGLVLCGTNVFRDEMKAGQFAKYLRQFIGRTPYEYQLPKTPDREDVDLFAAKFGLQPAEGEAEEIMWEVLKEGGFAKLVARLQDAAEIASKKKTGINWEHFVKAHNIVKKMALER